MAQTAEQEKKKKPRLPGIIEQAPVVATNGFGAIQGKGPMSRQRRKKGPEGLDHVQHRNHWEQHRRQWARGCSSSA